MRADLEPDVDAGLGHRADGGTKLHRLADAARPIVRGAIGSRTLRSSHRAEKRHIALRRAEALQILGERIRGRLHHGVVEGMGHTHEAVEYFAGLELRRDFLERRAQTGNGHGPRTIERRDTQG